MEALELGVEIHEEIIRNGFLYYVVVENSLIDMYEKCGSIWKARELFYKMHQQNVVSQTTMRATYAHNQLIDEALKFFKEIPQRNVVSWNVMIAGFTQNGHCKEALKLLFEMKLMGIRAN